MSGKKNSNLIVIENGQIKTYLLDDKLQWDIGRPSKENKPDIKLYSSTVSRKHGSFRNMDGIWFYVDGNGKNGTVYNKKRIKVGLNGRVKPVMLSDGDILVFGGGDEEVINSATIWTMFSNRDFDEIWCVADTKDYDEIGFCDGYKEIRYHKPEKGMVVNMEKGIAIYMGDITYISGNIKISGF